jgi:hypothetical protein
MTNSNEENWAHQGFNCIHYMHIIYAQNHYVIINMVQGCHSQILDNEMMSYLFQYVHVHVLFGLVEPLPLPSAHTLTLTLVCIYTLTR